MIEWNITQLDRRTEDGFVTTAHWTCSAVDGDFSASVYGTCGFDGDLTTPYDNLTKEQVLGWVWEQISKEDTEASVLSQIEAQKNPVSASGVPW